MTNATLGTLALTFLSHRAEHPDAAAALADLQALIQERDDLRYSLGFALAFCVEQVEPLRMLWEKGLDSPERKHNEARNHILMNARAALAATADNRSAQGGE